MGSKQLLHQRAKARPGGYVDYLRREGKAPVVFALHVSAPSFSALREFRKTFAVKLLKNAGLAPEAL